MEQLIKEYGGAALAMIAGMLLLVLVFALYKPGGQINGIMYDFMGGLTG